MTHIDNTKFMVDQRINWSQGTDLERFALQIYEILNYIFCASYSLYYDTIRIFQNDKSDQTNRCTK